MVHWQLIIVFFVWVFALGQIAIVSFLFLPLLYKYSRIFFWILVPPLAISFIMFLYSYYKTVFTNPGYHSHNINSYYDDLQHIKQKAKQQQQIKQAIHSGRYPNLQTQFNQIDSLQETSYCFRCNKIKQPRTHHCSSCGQCVLRMDHHCPWTANCIGKYNHKYFLLFLFYGSISVVLLFIIIFGDYIQKRPLADQLSQNKRQILYIAVFSAVMLGTAVIFLFCFQIYMLAKNITTIQNFVNGMSQPFRKNTFVQNMAEIMGDSYWLIPTSPFRHQDRFYSKLEL